MMRTGEAHSSSCTGHTIARMAVSRFSSDPLTSASARMVPNAYLLSPLGGSSMYVTSPAQHLPIQQRKCPRLKVVPIPGVITPTNT